MGPDNFTRWWAESDRVAPTTSGLIGSSPAGKLPDRWLGGAIAAVLTVIAFKLFTSA